MRTRYIDADALYKETEKRIKEANSYRMAVVDDEFLDLINDAFTEDVVPRETIEQIFEEIEKIIIKHLNDAIKSKSVTAELTIDYIELDIAELKKKYIGE